MKDVAFSCDDAGAKFLCVTVWSLLEHYRGDEPLRINVFEGFGGHSEGSKSKLRAIVEEWNKRRRSSTSTCDSEFFSVRYHDVEPYVKPYSELILNREKSRWNVFTWTPIFTPAILSDVTGNVAHFDIDMLFNDDVSKILDLDLGENLIAAVAEYGKGDPVITEAVWGKGILPPEAERYFNTGTIVFNAEQCRAERTWEKILSWYRDHYDIADRIEQDAWNALYWKRTRLLPLRWNFHDRLVKRFAKWDFSSKYWLGNPPRECLEAAVNPAILHFWGPKKPWKPSHRPYRRLYHAAMRAVGQTPPREQLLSPVHDVIARLRMAEIRPWLQFSPSMLEKLPLSRSAIVRKWRTRLLVKGVKHTLLLPFEWMAIGVGMAVLGLAPHKLMLKICDVASLVYYRFDWAGRRLSLTNLRQVLLTVNGPLRIGPFDVGGVAYDPSSREEKIIRGSYRNMVRTVGHAFWTCFNAKSRVRSVGVMSESGKRFLAGHNPAVTVSGHIGCWEILSQLAFLEGHRMMSVAKRIGSAGMTKFLMRARESIGQEIVPADGAFKSLMAGIRNGKSIGLLVDQRVDPNEGGVWVRFLGLPMSVSAAPAFFAAKAKAPIVIAWSRPLKDGRYRCETLSTITADEAKDVWRTTQRCATTLERIIRRHPSRWVMNYNFFSNVPTEKDLAQLAERERRATAMGVSQ